MTHYPDCENCELHLLKNSEYQVVRKDTILNTGVWRGQCSGDAFIVFIDEHERLGSGKYRY